MGARLDMKITRVLSAAVLLGHVCIGVASAQTTRTEVPAEFPPSSYTGSQYVDSRGCVYIRAGIDGDVNWVPRMTSGRQHICNATPTNVARAPAPSQNAQRQAAASTTTSAPVVLPAPGDVAPAATQAPEPRPAPRPVASRAAPAPVAVPAPRRVAAQPAQPVRVAPTSQRRVASVPGVVRPATPKPRQIAVPAQKTVTHRAPAVRRVAQAQGCRWASSQSARYMRGEGVRCGPQAVSPVSGPPRDAAVSRMGHAGSGTRGANVITPTTRVAPLHVAKMQAQAADVGRVPPGYRLVWEDDRLNPRRAHQTLEGKRQMDLRWTRDLPRRLVDISTGLDVTAFNPDLVYPYTSLDQQRAALRQPRGYLSTQNRPETSRPTVSTRSAPRAVKPAADATVKVAVSHRYVQVGRYGSDAEARADAARLGRAGLSVRMGTLHSGGSTARVLLAGPYATPQALGNALHAARRAGFGNAFTRR